MIKKILLTLTFFITAQTTFALPSYLPHCVHAIWANKKTLSFQALTNIVNAGLESILFQWCNNASNKSTPTPDTQNASPDITPNPDDQDQNTDDQDDKLLSWVLSSLSYYATYSSITNRSATDGAIALGLIFSHHYIKHRNCHIRRTCETTIESTLNSENVKAGLSHAAPFAIPVTTHILGSLTSDAQAAHEFKKLTLLTGSIITGWKALKLLNQYHMRRINQRQDPSPS